MTRLNLELVHSESDYALGYVGPLFVTIWRRETTLGGVRHLATAIRQWARDGQQRGMLTILEPGAHLPDAHAREMVADLLSNVGEAMAVSAMVFEGSGFKSAAIRGVVTGLTMIARQSYPHRLFESLPEAAVWICERAPKRWDLTPDQLEIAVGELRELIPD